MTITLDLSGMSGHSIAIFVLHIWRQPYQAGILYDYIGAHSLLQMRGTAGPNAVTLLVLMVGKQASSGENGRHAKTRPTRLKVSL